MASAFGSDAVAVVAAAASGDEAAFARIVTTHHGDMSRVAYLVSGDLEIAADAVQKAWAIAWRRLGSLNDPNRLRPWLVTIAANEARQLLRRRRRGVVELSVEGLDDTRRRGGHDADGHDRLLDLRAA